MRQKLIATASLAGLLLTVGATLNHAIPGQDPEQQLPHAAIKMVAGKVTSIGNGGQSFDLEVMNSGGDLQTMQFIVGKDAKVEGRVRVGAAVTVEYETIEGGQNRALNITAQG